MDSIAPSQRGSFAAPLQSDSSFASMTSAFVDLAYAPQHEPIRRSFSTAKSLAVPQNNGSTHFELRGRGLTQLPAFGKEAGLLSIDLCQNGISNLELAPDDLPEALQVLSLSSNKLSDLCQLKYLTACTALTELDVSDNPLTDAAARIGFDLRPFALFLLPGLRKLNGQDVRQPRLLETSRTLFTDGRGQLSDRLLELLDDGRQVELTHYLNQQLPLVHRPRHVDSAPTSPRPPPSPKTLQTLSFDETPVGGKGGRRGVSFSGGSSEYADEEKLDRSNVRKHFENEESVNKPLENEGLRSLRKRGSENVIMASGGFGESSPVVEKRISPRSPNNRSLGNRARAVRSRPREVTTQGRETPSRNSPKAGDVQASEKTGFSSTEKTESSGRVQSLESVNSLSHKASAKKPSLSRAGEQVVPTERTVTGPHVALPEGVESPTAEVEREMVKRLLTAELLATTSSSQVENLAGDVKGRFQLQSQDLSDVRTELSGVRSELSGVQKEFRSTRTQGNQELAEVWAELTEVRTELRTCQEEFGRAQAELSRVQTELAEVGTELVQSQKDARVKETEVGVVRTELLGARTELGHLRSELGAVRTELGQVRTDLGGLVVRLQAESDARTLLEEALRRMWAECLSLRAWKEEEGRRKWERAAVKVQRVWRLWRARREHEVRKEERRRAQEVLRPRVVLVQAFVRGFLQRRWTSRLRARTIAAIHIQSAVRGYIQRKKFKKKLWKVQKETWALQEAEALRVQVYQMQLWMHQMAVSIASAGTANLPPPIPGPPQRRGG